MPARPILTSLRYGPSLRGTGPCAVRNTQLLRSRALERESDEGVITAANSRPTASSRDDGPPFVAAARQMRSPGICRRKEGRHPRRASRADADNPATMTKNSDTGHVRVVCSARQASPGDDQYRRPPDAGAGADAWRWGARMSWWSALPRGRGPAWTSAAARPSTRLTTTDHAPIAAARFAQPGPTARGRPLPEENQAPARPRLPPQRIRAGRVRSQGQRQLPSSGTGLCRKGTGSAGLRNNAFAHRPHDLPSRATPRWRRLSLQ
jgi:hypothetical protein